MTALVDAAGPLPQPTLTQQLAVSMADRMPGVLVRVLGVRGMLGLAWGIAAPLRVVGAVVGMVFGFRHGAAGGRA